jgi:IclR family pca regulon transcriptional regulator
MTSAPDAEYIVGLERGLTVIRAFSAAAPAQTIAQVAERTGLTRAVARRYLLTLERLGYMARDGTRFSPTPRLLELGFTYLASISVADVAQPFIERLVEQLHESCSVAVLDGRECVYVARVPARRIITTALVVGSRVPAHATAMGKMLLAQLSPDDLDAYFAAGPLERYTRFTICDEARLRRALSEVRGRGWAAADQEYVAGLRTIAAPILDRSNRVKAAANIAGAVAVVSMKDMIARYLPVLRSTTREISRALGAAVRP